MRIGIFSDVHANLEALAAVMAAYQHENIDEYYCLGDVVGYGPQPEECSTAVRQIARTTVIGNHDAAVAGRMDYTYYYDAARKAIDAHAALLSPENKSWFGDMPYMHRIDEHGLLLCHGSPVDLEAFDYVFLPDQARECFSVWNDLPALTLIGHSHLCKVFALKKETDTVEELAADTLELKAGWKYIVSVGSVGQPRDYDNRASYTIFDTFTKTLAFKRVAYDISAVAKKVLDQNLEPHFANRLVLGT